MSKQKPKEVTYPFHDRAVEKQFFTPRDYQLELLSYACDHNTIVSLSSDAGKTFLAVLLIKEFAFRLKEKKENAILILENDELIKAYADRIHNHVSVRVAILADLSKYNNKDNFADCIRDHDVLIMSPSSLLRLLDLDYYNLSSAALLIVDECHKALAKNSVHRQIMQYYRDLPKDEAPRVLGLSGTILNDSCKLWELEKGVQRLEDVMCSRLESVNDLVSVVKYNARPTQFIVKCADPDYTKFESIKIQLKKLSDFLEELTKVDMNQTECGKPGCVPCKTARDAVVAVTHSFQQLGVWCAWKSCQVYGRRISNVLEIEGSRLDRMEKRLLLSAGTLLHECNGELGKLMGDAKTAEELKPYMDSRLVRLLETLAVYHPDKPDRPHADPLRGLVFVKDRFAAYCINALLKHLAEADKENYGFINSNFAVGNAGKLAATKDESSASHQQNAVLQRFRHQSGINLLVATSVLEEGIELPHCNLVVRYDPPDGFRSFVQSRGRAKSPGAAYFLLTYSKDCDKFEKALNRYLQMQEFITKYIRLDTIPFGWENLKEMDVNAIVRPFIVPYSRIRVTAFNAIEYINRYCAKLPSDIFTRLTPQIRTFRLGDGFGADISFPINSSFKTVVITDKPMTSKKLAISYVAVKACKMLLKAGELDVRMQSKTNHISLQSMAQDRTSDKKRLYHKRRVSCHVTNTLATAGVPCYLYAIELNLVKPIPAKYNLKNRRIINPKEIESSFGFLTTKIMPPIPDFPVYQRQGDVFVHFRLCPEMITITEEQSSLIEKFHEEVFSDVLDLKDNIAFLPLKSQMQLLLVPLKKKGILQDSIEYILDEDILHAATKFNAKWYPSEEDRSKFEFRKADFEDKVVTPYYRNKDNVVYFYVGEVRDDQTPLSTFPDNDDVPDFVAYFLKKYKLNVCNKSQNLLEVDHTSNRKNLLLPRSIPSRSIKRVLDNQRQLLIPELVNVHYLNASYFEMATSLPTIFYRLNALLLADELRERIVMEALFDPHVEDGDTLETVDAAVWDELRYDAVVDAIRNAEQKKCEAHAPAKKKAAANGDGADDIDERSENESIYSVNSLMSNGEKEVNESDTNGSVHEKETNGKTTDNVESGKQNGKVKSDDTTGEVKSEGQAQENGKASSKHQNGKADSEKKKNEANGKADSVNQNGKINGNADSEDKKDDSNVKADSEDKKDQANGKADSEEQKDEANGKADSENQNGKVNGNADSKDKKDQANGKADSEEKTSKANGKADSENQNGKVNGNADSEDKTSKANGKVDSVNQNGKANSEEKTNEANGKAESENQNGKVNGNADSEDSSKVKKDDSNGKADSEDKKDQANGKADSEEQKDEANGKADSENQNGKVNGKANSEDQSDDEADSEDSRNDANEEPEDEKDADPIVEAEIPILEIASLDPIDSVEFTAKEEKFAKVYLTDYFHIGVWNPDDAKEFIENDVTLNHKKPHPQQSKRRSGPKRTRAGGLLADETVAEMRAIGYTSALSAEAEMSDDEDTDYDILMDAKDSMHLKLAYLGGTIFENGLRNEATGWDDCVIPDAIIDEETGNNVFNMPVSGNQSEIDVNTLMQDMNKNYDKIQQAYDNQAAIIESSNPEVLANAAKDVSNGNIAYAREGNFVNLTDNDDDMLDESEKPDPPRDVKLMFGENDVMELAHDGQKAEETNPKAEDKYGGKQRKLPIDYTLDGVRASEIIKLPMFEEPDEKPDNDFSFDHDYFDRMNRGVSPALLLQALTTASAGDGINLELLETIGDSFLKLATTNYLYHTFPKENEGLLSYRRSKSVSNVRLSALGIKNGIVQVMETMRFDANNNWLPPCYVTTVADEAVNVADDTVSLAGAAEESNWGDEHADQAPVVRTDHVEGVESYNLNSHSATGGPPDGAPTQASNPFTQQSISNKAVADSVEALIGAHLIYLGPTGALRFMKWIGIDVLTKKPPLLPPCYIFDDRLAETQELYVLYTQFNFEKLEETIKYKFRNKSYLVQAFTHASYHKNRVTGCYQRLEFLGDAVLDYLITRYYFEYKKKVFTPGILTDLRSALVNNTLFASMAIHYGLHKHFMALCPGLFNMIEKFATLCETRYKKAYVNFDGDLSVPVNEQDAETEEDVEVPKALGDIFESLAGAIYLDSDMQLDVVWKVFYRLMKETIELMADDPPQSPIRQLFELKNCRIQFTKMERIIESGKVRVTVNVNNATYTGMGRSYRIAKCTAARKALEDLRKNPLPVVVAAKK